MAASSSTTRTRLRTSCVSMQESTTAARVPPAVSGRHRLERAERPVDPPGERGGGQPVVAGLADPLDLDDTELAQDPQVLRRAGAGAADQPSQVVDRERAGPQRL